MGNARRGALVTTALAVSAVLATTGAAPAAVPTVESTSERVLQSVSVSMASDGTTTAVGGQVVRTDGDVEDAETTEETYAPQEVTDELPVRVLTAWRTAEGAGTDLSDLQGYTGRVAIDLTVQNLTVRPEVLTYDAAGSSREQAALVGSPLSITASASLGDLKADRVVTDHKGTGANVTNGVVGRDGDGTTVQWAALLAPPILSASSELSLVVDAKDFDVPTIDLSVQPGLVTDPSIGALVGAAFNPATSSELELQQRTIGLIGEVNTVLARASATIADVRRNLTSSAETLGSQTVADLQSSTASVTSNMSSLDAALQSLRADLSSTLEATGSSALAEMQQAVDAVDRMLGDTSAQPQTAQVRGTGCETTVADPKQAETVFGSLLQVAGQLDGYSRATEACKSVLQESITDIIGDLRVDADSCRTTTSLTCSLFDTRVAFDATAEKLRRDLKDALDALRPDLYEGAVEASDALVAQADRIKDITDLIDVRRKDLTKALYAAVDTLRTGEIFAALEDIEDALDDVHADAEQVADQMVAHQQSAQRAADVVCQLVDQRKLEAPEGERIRRELVDYDCGEPATPPVVSEELQRILAATDVDQGSAGAAQALAEARASTERAAVALESVMGVRDSDGDQRTLNELFEDLNAAFGVLDDKSGALRAEIEDIAALAGTVSTIGQQIDRGVDTAKGSVATTVEDASGEMVGVGGEATDELGQMFERSASGLSSSADTVVRDGRKTIDRQKSEFFSAQTQAGNRITETVERGLAQINSGVTSSTRDMEAATTLLTADLRKVLLDLGERRVDGGGLLGAMATNAATARTADYQLALAADASTAYANVRSRDVEGLMLRQAQTDAAMQMLSDLPAFRLDLPSGSQHRTVYSFTIGDGR